VTRDEAEGATQLRAVVGSTLHGVNLEGTDDRDEMGVVLEPFCYAAGLRSFDQFIYRTAAEREGTHDAKSQPGDLDLTLYSLKKYVRLALSGNPTIMLLLFVPPEQCIVRTVHGARLQELASALVSRKAGRAFLGYLQAQRQRLLGERGGKKVQRPDLEAAYSYDTKYAMHMLRLGYQGVELLSTGRLAIPMDPALQASLLAIRRGETALNTVLTAAGALEEEIRDLLTVSPLDDQPDYGRAEQFLMETYGSWWSTEWNGTYRSMRERGAMRETAAFLRREE
jgi:uncharacterized protein